MNRKSLILTVSLILALVFSGSVFAKEVLIGFSQATMESPFYVALTNAAEERAKELGVKLIYADAQEDFSKQNSDIIDFITRGVDVLIVNPVNPQAISPALNQADGNDIPVITVDRPADGREAVFVGRKNYNMGMLAGEIAAEFLKQDGGKKILEVQGAAGCQVMMDRRDGFHEVVEQLDVEIIQSPYAFYVRSQAIAAVQDLIQTHPDVDLIYAHNDDMALGALQVLEQSGRTDVRVVGVDGLMEAIKAIGDGRMHATVMNDPAYLGRLAVEVALGVLDGEEYPEFVDAGTALVTIDNAEALYNPDITFATDTSK